MNVNKLKDEKAIDEAVKETMPASDPPAWSPGVADADPERMKKQQKADEKGKNGGGCGCG